jgi:nitronate monooxygenase
MFDLTELRIPIVQAPMAGGPSTVALAAAVCQVGGLGFLAAGYQSLHALAEQIDQLRTEISAPFGVNVFVPQPPPDPTAITGYREELTVEAERYNVELPEPNPEDDDHWADKIRLLIDHPVPVVSFTFGAPPETVVTDLHRSGTYVVVTVTAVREARTAAEVGADALCVQGPDAGGHRGTYNATADSDTTPLLELLAMIGEETTLPRIAAGGLATGADIAAVLQAGARAAQLGTTYLRTPESGANPTYKAALADPRFSTTVVTRAFSGRPARGLRNRFIDAHHATAPAGYPLINQLTRPLRAAAAAQGDPDGLALWAGTGHQLTVDAPAATLSAQLWESAEAVLKASPTSPQHPSVSRP